MQATKLSRIFWITLSLVAFGSALAWRYVIPAYEECLPVVHAPKGPAIQISEQIRWEPQFDLTGSWKFATGDDMRWASPDYDDTRWVYIQVPGAWEQQGWSGYDGYAWYRLHFSVPEELQGQALALDLGRVDDADEVYLNGFLVGRSGAFPPTYETAYDQNRQYYLNSRYLNPEGENVLAVRVYDAERDGGIMEGDIGLVVTDPPLETDLDLSGTWDFILEKKLLKKGDNIEDSDWDQLQVPGTWESQGYPGYDGFAWYRKTVVVPEKYRDEPMVLVLGRIDDTDQTYINGRLVGSLGAEGAVAPGITGREYKEFRGYYIPEGTLVMGKPNLITVRVYDALKDGGIYEGPIGLVTQRNYIRYWNARRNGVEPQGESRMY